MSSEVKPILILAGLVIVLFVLNWYLGWRSNQTDIGRSPETWQGWNDGHGGGI